MLLKTIPSTRAMTQPYSFASFLWVIPWMLITHAAPITIYFPACLAISLQHILYFSPFCSLFFSFDMWYFIWGGGNFHVHVGDVRDSSGLPAAAVKMGIESLHFLNLALVLGK